MSEPCHCGHSEHSHVIECEECDCEEFATEAEWQAYLDRIDQEVFCNE